jgi:hypothetical protein
MDVFQPVFGLKDIHVYKSPTCGCDEAKGQQLFFHDVTSMMMAVIVVWFSVARG